MSEEIRPDAEPVEPAEAAEADGDVEAHLAAGQDAVLGLQKLTPEREASIISDPAGSGGSCHNISCF
ncbi:hypothetical protein ACGFZJ_41375 [Streptomyces sp. NPDC048253]|jgi:hypothetical protein|uniref:hypothetical protein n=1 Tax=unclassified Streptomyces TaxID=2593676 RepID=UPI0006BABF77|nr:hypothetical protein [Streptomyces sp. NBC_00103]KPI22288.1 hypothetical protein OV320_1699 [Actinobacteria bacterium OV320]MCX5372824.1 hypothetical protein [Streptomyces sp. NBC_00103]